MLDGDPALPSQKGHSSPHLSSHVYCDQTAGWIKIPLSIEVGLDPGDIVLDGNSAPPRKGAQQRPPLLAHVYCGQTAGWIKIPLSTDVGLGLGDVLDADPAPSTFGPCLLWPNGPYISATAELIVYLLLVVKCHVLLTTKHFFSFSFHEIKQQE